MASTALSIVSPVAGAIMGPVGGGPQVVHTVVPGPDYQAPAQKAATPGTASPMGFAGFSQKQLLIGGGALLAVLMLSRR